MVSDSEKRQWFVLGMRYVKASTVAAAFRPMGVECFVPPVVTNLLFVHDTRKRIDEYLAYSEMGQKLYLLRDKASWQAIVVRDKDMDIFMTACKAQEAPIIMTESPKVKLGDKVRVTEGDWKGVEGYVVRLKKQKRVLINVSNVLWAATAYIRPEQLEVINE